MNSFDLTKYKKGKLEYDSIPIMAGLEKISKQIKQDTKKNNKSNLNKSLLNSNKDLNENKNKELNQNKNKDLNQNKNKELNQNKNKDLNENKNKELNQNKNKELNENKNNELNENKNKELEKIHKENWLKIPLKSNIRYIRNDDNGGMHHGFLMNIIPNKYQFELGSRSIDDYRCKKWIINLYKVTDIFIKQNKQLKEYSEKNINNQIPIKNNEIITNNHNKMTTNNYNEISTIDYSNEINQLRDDIYKLKNELKRMANEQKRILLLIKKLHSHDSII
jgi:hypothetical protein